MNIFTNQRVARYIAAPMIGIGILGGTTLAMADIAGAATATGDPGTSQTITTGFGQAA